MKCRIRRDLLERGLSVPVGNTFISKDIEYSYKWINWDEQFLIKLDGEWKEAESIDFEFSYSPVPKEVKVMNETWLAR